MARKKKKRAKRLRPARWFFSLIGRFFYWLGRDLLGRSRKNPMLACGLVLFAVAFGFVSKNAFFNQPDAVHAAVFQSTGPGSSGSAAGAALIQTDADLKAIQQKLADLGLYEGAIDGLSGPRTRAAIQQWLALQQQTGRQNIPAGADSVTVGAIASAPSRTVVMQVQMALREFGNGDVVVNGVVDATTETALLAFQEMFALPQTGRIDQALLDKMREIGLPGL